MPETYITEDCIEDIRVIYKWKWNCVNQVQINISAVVCLVLYIPKNKTKKTIYEYLEKTPLYFTGLHYHSSESFN